MSTTRVKMLTAEQEAKLIEAAQKKKDQKAREVLLKAHEPLVRKLATKYARAGQSREDLIQDGQIGLIKALSAFDPSRGVRFGFVAKLWIEDEMQRSVKAERSGAMRVTAGGRAADVARHFPLARNAWEQRHGRAFDETGRDALAAEFGVSRRVLDRAEAWTVAPHAGVSLDGLEAVGSEPSVEENPGLRLESAQRRQLLREATRHLSPRERQVIELRYLGEEPLTYPEISQTLGLTPERARQLENLALASLRAALAGVR